MRVSTEHIRLLRNQYAYDRDRSKTAPEKVRQRLEDMLAILNELLAFREAIDADQQPERAAQLPLLPGGVD